MTGQFISPRMGLLQVCTDPLRSVPSCPHMSPSLGFLDAVVHAPCCWTCKLPGSPQPCLRPASLST